ATFGIECDELGAAALTSRFPGYRLPADAVAIFQRDGGFLRPEACVTAHVALARRRGAEIRERERVLGWHAGDGGVGVRTTTAEHPASRLVLTAGAWRSALVGAAKLPLAPERQVMLWTQPLRPALFQPGAFPVFYMLVAEGPFYGFPSHDDRGFKIG